MSGRNVGLLVVGLGLLATGCPNPNLYGTPRTVPAGKVAGFAALEGVGWSVKTKPIVPENDTWTPDNTYSQLYPMAPSFGGRVGIVDRFDIGFRLSGFTTPGADLKWNFLRTDVLDLAADAGIEYAPLLATRVHLPLLVGLNFSEKVSLVLLPGVMYGMSNLDDRFGGDTSTFRTVASAGGWYGRLGVGLNVRFNKKMALQPEVTFVKAFKQEEDPFFASVLVYNVGLGISFGNLPDYGPPEVPTAPPLPPPPAAAPAPTPAATGSAPAPAGTDPLPAAPPPPPGAGTPTPAGH
jgi:hypothetical protein